MSKIQIYCGIAPFPFLKGYIRDNRPMWLLEEISAPYEAVYVDPRADTQKPEYLAINPFGKVPAMKDGDLALFESVAICEYIADKFGKLAPAPGTPARYRHDQWLIASVANFEFNANRIFACDHFFDKGADTDAKRANAFEGLDNWLPQLDRHLGKSPYLSGEEFQLCDLIMTTVLRYMAEKDYLAKYPATRDFVMRNMDRSAFQRMNAKNGVKPS